MASPDLPRRSRRRRAPLMVLRSALVATGLLAVYYTAPLDAEFDLGTVAGLCGGLIALGMLIGWQAWVVSRARHPRLRAIEALVTSVSLFLLIFATAYLLLDGSAPGSFSEPMTRTDSLYLALTMFSTVGFGDIAPLSAPARILTMVQMLGDLLIVGLVARILVGAVQRGLERRPGGPAGG